jgi:hypothetical protein
VQTSFTVVKQEGGPGIVEVATEDYAAWMPAATFKSPFIEGTRTVGGVRFAIDGDGKLRLEVMT